MTLDQAGSRLRKVTSKGAGGRGGRMERLARAPRGLRRQLSATELDRALAAVDQWRALEHEISEQRRQLVVELRGRGVSWDSIGWLLGVTGRAVSDRYGS